MVTGRTHCSLAPCRLRARSTSPSSGQGRCAALLSVAAAAGWLARPLAAAWFEQRASRLALAGLVGALPAAAARCSLNGAGTEHRTLVAGAKRRTLAAGAAGMQVQTLIVTDVAARGIDIPLLDNVINYGERSAAGGRHVQAHSWLRAVFTLAVICSLIGSCPGEARSMCYLGALYLCACMHACHHATHPLPSRCADFPPKPKLFVHRSGRAARAGRTGTAYSLLTRWGGTGIEW